jgi:hypothetical protein
LGSSKLRLMLTFTFKTYCKIYFFKDLRLTNFLLQLYVLKISYAARKIMQLSRIAKTERNLFFMFFVFQKT